MDLSTIMFFQELNAVNNLQKSEYIFLSSMLNPSHDKVFTIQSNFEDDRTKKLQKETRYYKKNGI